MPENRYVRGGYLLLRRYWHHGVAMQSAALAFYLLFAIFPFLILLSALIGLLQLNVAVVLQHLQEFVPDEVLYLLEMYLRYVGENASLRLLWFGLVFSVYFPMRSAFDEGGYEARSSRYVSGVAEALIEGAKEMLGEFQ